MRDGVVDAGAHHEQLGKAGFMRRAAAEIGGDGLANGFFVVVGQRQQALQPVLAHDQRREWLGGEGAALCLEAFAQQIGSDMQHAFLHPFLTVRP